MLMGRAAGFNLANFEECFAQLPHKFTACEKLSDYQERPHAPLAHQQT